MLGNHPPGGRLRQRGFSLVEMSVSVFLLSVMALLVLPNLGRLSGKSRLLDATRQAESAFQLARMRAINERNDYVVQFTGASWNVFSDRDNDGTRDTGEPWTFVGDNRLPSRARFEFPSGGAPVTAGSSESVIGNSCKCTRFDSSGTMRTASASTLNQVLSIGDGKEYRQITVSAAGAIKVQRWNPTRQAWE